MNNFGGLGSNILDEIWEECLTGLAVVDAEGRWLKVNPAFCQILGYTEIELKQMTFQDVTLNSDTADDVANAKAVMAGQLKSYTMLKHYIHKEKRVVAVNLKVTPIRKKDGTFNHFLSQAEERNPQDPKLQIPVGGKVSWAPFLKNNWKWLLPMVSAVCFSLWSFFAGITSEYYQTKHELQRVQRELSEIRGSQEAEVKEEDDQEKLIRQILERMIQDGR